MNSPEKRAREDKRNQKARIKEQRRLDRRAAGRSEPEIVSAADINGNVPSIEEVMLSISGEARVERSAPPIPVKLFVGSLNDATTSASLRRHFEPHSAVLEAAVITDRNTGASRNFGFVTLADRKSAGPVISELHQSELDGNRIVVNIATEKR